MRVNYAEFSKRVEAGSLVKVIGNIHFPRQETPHTDEEGILICHDFNVDQPARIEGWHSIIPDTRYIPVHINAVCIQFFRETVVREIDPLDLSYFVNGAWQTFKEVMA